ncbi:TonB-dependent receptor [Pseudoxanthomonas sp. z9]|uniref:TonB-dependent receptor n=1 Tax=Pseudoxanthomonas sp. z9 TaxID=2584942 RepID=UPI001141B61A|nr:TonB-dependent receptor [Pseudoxanthomonas sp. z9]MCL6713803.1 TonB-dependent receptor [Pseudomonas sp. R2.Fl]
MTTHKGYKLSKGIKRTALSLALGACFIGGVQAQTNTAGAVAGRAEAGDTIKVTNPSTGFSRTFTVGNDGSYRFAQLPTGQYQITRNGGEPRSLTVSVGTSTNVDFVGGNTQTLDAVTVTGTLVNPIDVSSVESTVVLTEQQIDRLPVARDATSMALLAPGTTLGDSRLGGDQKQGGKLASFGGSSVAENVYYINGFNVTNLINGVAFSELPFEAVSEAQIKNGGYGAEFGRSLGGVINVIGKRGTNEWKFGGNVIYSPDWGRGSPIRYIPNPNLYFDGPDANTTPEWQRTPSDKDWIAVETPGYNESLRYNVYASGPIVKDRLFFYALAQGTDGTTKTYGNTEQSENKSDAPQYYVKLDWYITDNHVLEVTGFRDREEQNSNYWFSNSSYGTGKGAQKLPNSYQWGGDNYIGKWTGYFGDSLTLSALYGVGKYDHTSQIGAFGCPRVTDARTSPATNYGCWTVTSADRPDANEKRTAYRFDGEWVVGDHTIRFGVDNEDYDFVGGTKYTGQAVDGTSRIIRTLAPGGIITNNGYTNNTGAPIDYVEMRHFENGGEFTLTNSAYYLEDSWQITDNFMAYIGVRNESFENLNAAGQSFIKIDDTWAPRLGFSWDVNGDASFKLFGNLGRYYIPVMGNTNMRLAGAELDYTDYYAFEGTFTNDQYQLPVLGAQLGDRWVVSDGGTPDPRTVVDPNLKPMYQDELILGFQAQLSEKWVGGVRGVYRKLATVMDDYCSYQMPYDWAIENGYTADEADAIGTAVNHCFLMNVGEDLTMNADLHGDGNLTKLTIPASALGIPKAKRKYSALEFFFERLWDDKWTVQGSYTYSKSKGNTEGYVKSDIGQDDAGISAGFDYPALADGGYGYLPNDRRHVFKIFGAYQITDEWRVGGNFIAQSGRPVNCMGFPRSQWPEPGYAGYAMYCNNQLVPRGTFGRLEWNSSLSLNLTYEPTWLEGLRISADVFNVFNDRSVLSVNEQCESAANTTLAGCHQPLSANAPRQYRFTVEYDF